MTKIWNVPTATTGTIYCYCSECGKTDLNPDWKYCPKCGKSLDEKEEICTAGSF